MLAIASAQGPRVPSSSPALTAAVSACARWVDHRDTVHTETGAEKAEGQTCARGSMRAARTCARGAARTGRTCARGNHRDTEKTEGTEDLGGRACAGAGRTGSARARGSDHRDTEHTEQRGSIHHRATKDTKAGNKELAGSACAFARTIAMDPFFLCGLCGLCVSVVSGNDGRRGP